MGTTPKYAFPYPEGTDRVTDGDNAMGTLAQAVEDTMKTARYWATLKTGNGTGNSPWAAGQWYPVCTLVCTGAPVGAVLLALGNVEMVNSTVASNMMARWTNTGVTSAVGAQQNAVSESLNGYIVHTPLEGIFTVTTANPTINLDAQASGGATASGMSSLFVVRIV